MENKLKFKRDEILGYEINSGIPHLLTKEELKLAQKISERKKEKITSTKEISDFNYEKGFIQYKREEKITFGYNFKNLANLVINTLKNEDVPTVSINIRTILRLMDKISGLKDFDNLNFQYNHPEDIIKKSRYGSLNELVQDITEIGDFCEEKIEELKQHKKPVKDFSGLDEEDKKWLNEPKVALREREKLRNLGLEDVIHSNKSTLGYSAKKIFYGSSLLTKEILHFIEVVNKKSMDYLSKKEKKISEKLDKLFPGRYPIFILEGNEKKLKALLAFYAVHKIKNNPSYIKEMDKQDLEAPLKEAILREIIIPGVAKKEMHLNEKGNLKDWSLKHCSPFFNLCMEDYLKYVKKTSEVVDNVDKIFCENFRLYIVQNIHLIGDYPYKKVFRDFFIKGINNAPEPLHSLFVGKNSLNDKIFTKEKIKSIREGCEAIYELLEKGYKDGLEYKKEHENAKD